MTEFDVLKHKVRRRTRDVLDDHAHELAEYAWRIDRLRQVPAAVRFVSFEPLLGPLTTIDLTGIDWAIIGGESGRGSRTMPLDTLDGVVPQVDAAGVRLFVKQDSGPRDGQQGRIPDALWRRKEFPYAIGAGGRTD